MQKVILHCSDSEFGNAVLIDNWHRNRTPTPLACIGYHYVILNGQLTSAKHNGFFDGNIETGRPLSDNLFFLRDEIGAHCIGHNAAVGICLIGKSGQFTFKQISALKRLLNLLYVQYHGIEVFQHSDYDPKGKPFCAGISDANMAHLRDFSLFLL